MKQIAIGLALVASLCTPVLADRLGGISGTVVDATSGQPMANVRLYYYRGPWLENGPNHIMVMETNGRGYFSNITLEPGRYVVMARMPGKVEGCAIDDVSGGEVVRMKIVIGQKDMMCSGPRVHPAMIDPNTTADIYRI